MSSSSTIVSCTFCLCALPSLSILLSYRARLHLMVDRIVQIDNALSRECWKLCFFPT